MSHDYALKPLDDPPMPLNPKECSAEGCSNTTINRPALCFFPFPKQQQRLLLWREKCLKKEIKSRDLDFISKNCYICADHFDLNQFAGKFRKKLIPLAIPNSPKEGTKSAEQRKRASDSAITLDYTKQARLVNDSDVVNGTNVALKEVLAGITKQLGLPPNTKIVYSTTGQTSVQTGDGNKKTRKILLIKRSEKMVLPKPAEAKKLPKVVTHSSAIKTSKPLASTSNQPKITIPTSSKPAVAKPSIVMASKAATSEPAALTPNTVPKPVVLSVAAKPQTGQGTSNMNAPLGGFVLTPPLATSVVPPRFIQIGQNQMVGVSMPTPTSTMSPSIIRFVPANPGQVGTQPVFRLVTSTSAGPSTNSTITSQAGKSSAQTSSKTQEIIMGSSISNMSPNAPLGKLVTLALPVPSSAINAVQVGASVATGPQLGKVITLVPASTVATATTLNVSLSTTASIPSQASMLQKTLPKSVTSRTQTILRASVFDGPQGVKTYSGAKQNLQPKSVLQQNNPTTSPEITMMPRIVSTMSVAGQSFASIPTPSLPFPKPGLVPKVIVLPQRLAKPAGRFVGPIPFNINKPPEPQRIQRPPSKNALTQTILTQFPGNSIHKTDQLMQQNKEQKATLSALKRKITRLENRVVALKLARKEKLKSLTPKTILDGARAYLNDTSYDIFRLLMLQVDNNKDGRSSTGIRYADSTKDFALCVYCCSKTAYRVCQSVFKLPSIKSILRKTKDDKEKKQLAGLNRVGCSVESVADDNASVEVSSQDGGELQIIHEDPDGVVVDPNESGLVFDPSEVQEQINFDGEFDEHAAAVTLIQTVSGQEMEIVESHEHLKSAS